MHTHIHTINAHPLTATTKSGNNNVRCLNALPEYVTLQTIVNVYCCSKKGGLTNCYNGNRLSSVLGSMLVWITFEGRCSSVIGSTCPSSRSVAAPLWYLLFKYHPSADSGNDGSRESIIPFIPVLICACTNSINSYTARSVTISPRIVTITTNCTKILPQYLTSKCRQWKGSQQGEHYSSFNMCMH